MPNEDAGFIDDEGRRNAIFAERSHVVVGRSLVPVDRYGIIYLRPYFFDESLYAVRLLVTCPRLWYQSLS